MVKRWIVRDDTNPEPNKPLKYPAEIRKKKNPAWPWPIASSFSMVGKSGEKITREIKLRRKIGTRKNTGAICGQNELARRSGRVNNFRRGAFLRRQL